MWVTALLFERPLANIHIHISVNEFYCWDKINEISFKNSMCNYMSVCKRSISMFKSKALPELRGNKVVYTLNTRAILAYVCFQNKNTFFRKSWFLACLLWRFVTSKVLRCRLTFFLSTWVKVLSTVCIIYLLEI